MGGGGGRGGRGGKKGVEVNWGEHVPERRPCRARRFSGGTGRVQEAPGEEEDAQNQRDGANVRAVGAGVCVGGQGEGWRVRGCASDCSQPGTCAHHRDQD